MGAYYRRPFHEPRWDGVQDEFWADYVRRKNASMGIYADTIPTEEELLDTQFWGIVSDLRAILAGTLKPRPWSDFSGSWHEFPSGHTPKAPAVKKQREIQAAKQAAKLAAKQAAIDRALAARGRGPRPETPREAVCGVCHAITIDPFFHVMVRWADQYDVVPICRKCHLIRVQNKAAWIPISRTIK